MATVAQVSGLITAQSSLHVNNPNPILEQDTEPQIPSDAVSSGGNVCEKLKNSDHEG